MTILKAEEFMPEITEIQEIMSHFGLYVQSVTAFHDTSRGDDDRRLNYGLDNKYVLKINSSSVMSEQRLREIHRLIKRYHSIGVYCPRSADRQFLFRFYQSLVTRQFPSAKTRATA